MSKNIKKKHFDWKLALAAQKACILEVDAPKVGNVNRFHDFKDSTLEDFHCSALAIGRPFGYLEEQGVGRTIYEAVKATKELVSTNTNLGIVLLLAPLGMAWCRMMSRKGPDKGNYLVIGTSFNEWKKEIREVLEDLTLDDTRYVYQAIRLATPSGMGQVKKYDVFQDKSPRISLLEAMRLASEYDMVARQYTDDFELIFGIGYETLDRSLNEGLSLPKAIAHTHLFLLSQYQDSLITRKCGAELSREVQIRACIAWERGGWLTLSGQEHTIKLDRWLRENGHHLNPGTTADLMAAIIFVFLLNKDLTE